MDKKTEINPKIVKKNTKSEEAPDSVKFGVFKHDKPKPSLKVKAVTEGVEFAKSQKSLQLPNDRAIVLEQRVKVNGYQCGTVKFIGELESLPLPGMVYIGVKLDKPEGSGNGSINGVRYFDCEPFHSVFTTSQFIEPA